jgi:TolB protein
MRALLVACSIWLACLLSTPVLSQTSTLGLFTNSADIGGPPLKGAAEYDPAARRYRITGTGTDIWGKSDQFHFAWREMSGNFSVTATTEFLTGGNPHRKAVIMLRKTVEAESPFVHLAIHGDGMAAVQFRSTPGADTNTLDFPIGKPGIWKLKLTRQGGNVIVSIAPDGQPLRELGHTVNAIGSPVLVGLGVASHSQKELTTVAFSDVTIETLAPPKPAAPAPAPPAR